LEAKKVEGKTLWPTLSRKGGGTVQKNAGKGSGVADNKPKSKVHIALGKKFRLGKRLLKKVSGLARVKGWGRKVKLEKFRSEPFVKEGLERSGGVT